MEKRKTSRNLVVPGPDARKLKSISSQQGIALISVVWLLMILFAAATAMTMSGQTELWIARNDEAAAQAHAAAEAGANHALDVTVAYVEQWRTNGFANAGAAMSRLLRGADDAAGTADDGSLAWLPNGIPTPPARQPLAGSATVSYEARVFDEDDPARGAALQPADRTRIGEQEPANATADGNTRIVVRAIGYATGDTLVRLEATVGPTLLPALVTDGSLTMKGSPRISGSEGSVHTNVNLTLTGSPDVSQDGTATGSFTGDCDDVGGDCGGGRPEIDIPEVRASDYRSSADFILTSGGLVTNQAGTVLCNAGPPNKPNACRGAYGWDFNGANGWDLRSNSPTAGTYYVEGMATVSGSPGSKGSLLAMTIIAEGSINISGSPYFTPDTAGLLFVTDGDLRVTGNLTTGGAEGGILVHEQLDLRGTTTISGQIIVEDAEDISNVVSPQGQSQVIGNVTISYNGSLGGLAGFTVSAWREVR